MKNPALDKNAFAMYTEQVNERRWLNRSSVSF